MRNAQLNLHPNSVQFSQSCMALCDLMDCSIPGFPVHHHLLELAQIHVHQVSNTIEPSHPLLSFSSCLQSFPAPVSFPVSRLFESGGQSIGVSASASFLSMNIQGWFPLGLTDFISLLSKGPWRVFQYHSWKASIPWHSAFFVIQLSHPYMTTGKTMASTTWTFIGKVMSLIHSLDLLWLFFQGASVF